MHSRFFRKTTTNATFLKVSSCCFVVVDDADPVLVVSVVDVDSNEKRSSLAGVSNLRLLVEATNAVREE